MLGFESKPQSLLKVAQSKPDERSGISKLLKALAVVVLAAKSPTAGFQYRGCCCHFALRSPSGIGSRLLSPILKEKSSNSGSNAQSAKLDGIALSQLELVEHLLAQDARKSAALFLGKHEVLLGYLKTNSSVFSPDVLRLWRQLQEETCIENETSFNKSGEFFVVPRHRIRIVSDATTTSEFVHAMHEEVSRKGLVAIDAEWRPDLMLPSLLQIACDMGSVWLIDLESLMSTASLSDALRKVDVALAEVFSSRNVRVLGFQFKADLEKLSLVPSWRCSEIVTRLIDLSSLNEVLSTKRSRLGLDSHLQRWTGFRLDKAMQCTDWSIRPLSGAQISYAAADAACLFMLYQALLAHQPDAVFETDMKYRGVAQPSILLDCSNEECNIEGAETICEGIVLASVSKAAQRCGTLGKCRCRVVDAAEFQSEFQRGKRLELNSLCFVVDPLPNEPQDQLGQEEHVLILTLASTTLDLRWLSNILGVARRRLRMASALECSLFFGAPPGMVPPLPLRPNVRVLALPNLAVDGLEVWASAGHPERRLLIDEPSKSLPLLSNSVDYEQQSAPDANPFEWLPDPSRRFQSLDDAIVKYAELADIRPTIDAQSPVEAIVVSNLAPLGRKLRLIGVDCKIAGEVVKEYQPGQTGFLRVKVDENLADADLRRAAASGRLIIVPLSRQRGLTAGAYYRVRASDADDQFAEVVEVLHLQFYLQNGPSRCGICNGRLWSVLSKSDVAGQVPPAALENESEFYRCGCCKQIFWPGRKYIDKMESLRAHVARSG